MTREWQDTPHAAHPDADHAYHFYFYFSPQIRALGYKDGYPIFRTSDSVVTVPLTGKSMLRGVFGAA